MSVSNHNSKTPLEHKDNWITSDLAFKDALSLIGLERFDLDAAADIYNRKAVHYFSEERNSLECDWFGNAWCNPPFSLKKEFILKAHKEVLSGNANMVCMMIPFERATKWWRESIAKLATIVYVPDGRYAYIHPVTKKLMDQPKFASCFVVFTRFKVSEPAYVDFNRTMPVKKKKPPNR